MASAYPTFRDLSSDLSTSGNYIDTAAVSWPVIIKGLKKKKKTYCKLFCLPVCRQPAWDITKRLVRTLAVILFPERMLAILLPTMGLPGSAITTTSAHWRTLANVAYSRSCVNHLSGISKFSGQLHFLQVWEQRKTITKLPAGTWLAIIHIMELEGQ